ncbi:Nuclear pore complex protein nup96 [Turnera subulata]|uniref:Nuclear pore complex protein nup96 n=1 Tax=Turnera subulata TaxID=218843 RepID=A0A9Q0G0Z2_9ROSI|nr:Nuclear pore complex protein nup96 [Turnera subulata]
MASPSLLPVPGSSSELVSGVGATSQYKRRRISLDNELSCEVLGEIEAWLPALRSEDYYMEPCFAGLASRELSDPGFLSRVPDFTVGRIGFGRVKFLGKTDVRRLDLDEIVKFRRHEVVVYEDERDKPEVGQGLNKAAEVTLTLRARLWNSNEKWVDDVVDKLRDKTDRQGAQFISFDPESGDWKFLVPHFSRFGLSDDDEEDITMNDAEEVEGHVEMNGGEILDVDEENTPVDPEPAGPMLYHSLPAHLGLDPTRMKEMRTLMFPFEEEVEHFNGPSRQKLSHGKELTKPPVHSSPQRMSHRSNVPATRKTPLALLEYNPDSTGSSSPGTILMAQQNKALPLKMIKGEGFKLDLKHETPVTGSHSHYVVDSGLFMGRSFRVGWGPNGILVHCGTPVGSDDSQRVLSSVINVEKVAIDKVIRDENSKAKKELVDFAFDYPLNLHKALNHEQKEVELGSFKLKLQKVVSDRLVLSDICRSYIDIAERQLEVPGLSSFARLVLTHQVMIWELIRVLFSERENSGQSKSPGSDNEEDMMPEMKETSLEVDQEALPLIRRAEFSCWLQESVCHRVQEEVSSLDDSSYLEHIFVLLTGRQLDAAVEIAASRGDVRLACLLSQAGGSMVNRADVARQLDLWRMNGLDFNFIEKERIRLYEMLSGNIHGALQGIKIDWKRFLGLLMWYRLEPHTPLPIIFQAYQHLLNDGKALYPLPIYIDEGPAEEATNFAEKHFDLSYYLMLLHANGDGKFSFLKTMCSAFSSTHDPLDYHMIWHQRSVLEAVGVFNSNDLHILDMGIVSQLLCVGQIHWAIYVVLHIPYRDDYPYLHGTLIREILFQYCETWSSDESQRLFIENLDIPRAWLHEAMAVYFNYHGDLPDALEHYLECANWQKAHSLFVTEVAHKLFLSGNHTEIWRLASSMEDHKSEIENWDFGAGIYILFYMLKSSFQEDGNAMNELDSLDSKNTACRNFMSHLNESLAVLDERLPVGARLAYSKMAEEISGLLLADINEGSTRDDQFSCFDTVFKAPLPEDIRSGHLQDAVSLFTCYLAEMAS